MYDHIGYNMKPLDVQAAMGVVQLDKLDEFLMIRKRNYNSLYSHIKDNYSDYFHLPEFKGKSSHFCLPLVIKDGIKRKELLKHLESHGISTRLMFGGNIMRQPAYEEIRGSIRVCGNLINADKVTYDGFFLGVYPGINEEKIQYVKDVLDKFMVG